MKKKKTLTQPVALIDEAKDYILSFGGIRKAAKHLKVSPSYISMIFNVQSPVPDWMISTLGWETKLEKRK